jgi:TolB protein
MNPDGTGKRNLTRNAADDHAGGWSPDGRRIAFTSKRDGNSEIYVMNADGSGQRNLTRNLAGDARPAWSPLPRS